MVGRPSRAFSLPNATYLIHLWGEKNTPLGVITLGLRQAHLMRRWLTLATRLRPSALPSYRRIRDSYLPLTANFTVNFGGVYDFGSIGLANGVPALNPVQAYGVGIP